MSEKEFFELVAQVATNLANASTIEEIDGDNFDDFMLRLRYDVAARLDVTTIDYSDYSDFNDDAYRDLHAWDGGT